MARWLWVMRPLFLLLPTLGAQNVRGDLTVGSAETPANLAVNGDQAVSGSFTAAAATFNGRVTTQGDQIVSVSLKQQEPLPLSKMSLLKVIKTLKEAWTVDDDVTLKKMSLLRQSNHRWYLSAQVRSVCKIP